MRGKFDLPEFDSTASGLIDILRHRHFGGFILDVKLYHSMTPDTAAASDHLEDGDVMVSVDGDGPTARVVIADISRDEAWISFPLGEAAALGDWQ